MAVIIPIAGGKGGVGKSVLSTNLSVSLAARCQNVILCDFDFGGANLHTMLGLKNNQNGLGHFINKIETDMSALVQATGIPNLHFIAGDCLFPGAANIDFFTKQKIIRELTKLQCDYLILDLGAGSAHNIIDFFIMANNGVVIITPEITSVLNSYSFLKSVIYRFCYRQYNPKSPARQILKNSILQRLEGREYSFEQILSVIEKNSRIDTKELAIRFGTTEAAIVEEMAAMEMKGVICGYHTMINWEKTSNEKVIALIEVRVTKAQSDSTAARILALTETASERKTRSETFITRFAKVYTPLVCGIYFSITVSP